MRRPPTALAGSVSQGNNEPCQASGQAPMGCSPRWVRIPRGLWSVKKKGLRAGGVVFIAYAKAPT